MIWVISVLLLSYCSAKNNISPGADFEEKYSRIRLYEYTDYTDVIFLKFHIYAPTTLANWSVLIQADGKCNDYLANIHFYLQYGTYPLVAPKNETFPDMYITTRHDLFTKIFNQTILNGIVHLINPLQGTWFAMAFVERLSKLSSSNCNISLTTSLDYQAIPISLILILNQPLQIVLSNNLTFIYASYYTSIGNSRITISSDWSTVCDITILARMNGLPNSLQYDYQTVCKNGPCSFDIDQVSAYIWLYFQISVDSLSCLTKPVQGSILIQSTECLIYSNDSNCIPLYSTRRILSDSQYDFTYIPEYSNQSLTKIIFNGNDSSIYSYEFIVDERNIGGTLHFNFQTQIKSIDQLNTNISILGCLSKNRLHRYSTCENDYQIYIPKNSSVIRSLPYPEMGFWYLTLEYDCTGLKAECLNAAVVLTFQISSSKCTQDQCGTYGVCQIQISQENIFSTCTCLVGYRGYGCTDSRNNYAWKYIPSVLFLTLSNLMFIPAIVLSIYYRLYIEALVYFFNMFFSTFYHACDQEIRRFCIFKYDGLQLSDFIGSYSSFVITIITMSITSRSIKVFLFMLSILICVVLNSRDRFNSKQFIALVSILFGFTLLTWIIVSIKKRRLQPTWKHLLCLLPGILIAATGLVLFAFFETDENYWYTHSLWHICMAISILFFLPRRIKKIGSRRASSEVITSNSSVGVINEGATVIDDDHPHTT